MDKEERLRAAREKLKRYQMKRQNPSPSVSEEVTDNGMSGSTATAASAAKTLEGEGSVAENAASDREDVVGKKPVLGNQQIPLFTMSGHSSGNPSSAHEFPAFGDLACGQQPPKVVGRKEERKAELSSCDNSGAAAADENPSLAFAEDNLVPTNPLDPDRAEGVHKALSDDAVGHLNHHQIKGHEPTSAAETLLLSGGQQHSLQSSFDDHERKVLEGLGKEVKVNSVNFGGSDSLSADVDPTVYGHQNGQLSKSAQFQDLSHKASALENENKELQVRVQQQVSSIFHFQAYCKAQAVKLESKESSLQEAKTEFQKKLVEETECLNSKLRSHADSIQILVDEKFSLESSLEKARGEAEGFRVELENLTAENERMKKTMDSKERNIGSVDNAIMESLRRDCRNLTQSVDDLKLENEEMKSKLRSKEKSMASLTEELSMMSSKLELTQLNLDQLRSASKGENGSSSHDGEWDSVLKAKDAEVEQLSKENSQHLKRVEELTLYIQKATQDREQIIAQYTSYSQQLTGHIEVLTSSLNKAKEEQHSLTTREADLVLHVQRLEEQLQKMIQSQTAEREKGEKRDQCQDLRGGVNEGEEVIELREKLKEREEESLEAEAALFQKEEQVRELKLLLQESKQAVGELETKLEMAQDVGSVMSSNSELIAACESDKVAASRAVEQNQKMKEQIEELETALIQATNDKAKLATELDTAKHGEGTWKKMESTLASELDGLREAVKERDREMHQMKEQMKYYINFAENSIHGRLDGKPRNVEAEHERQVEKLVQELDKAKEQIRCLDSHNSELKSQLEVLSSKTPDSPLNDSRTFSSASPTPDLANDEQTDPPSPAASQSSSTSIPCSVADSVQFEVAESPNSVEGGTAAHAPAPPEAEECHRLREAQGQQEQEEEQESEKRRRTPEEVVGGRRGKQDDDCNLATEGHPHPRVAPPASVPVLSTEVALLKLEQKFKEAMEQNVELAAEKEQLEHLVMQLQEETDTVGEYITIYQYQRQQQKMHLAEKELQLHTLARDREELKDKMAELQSLLKKFVAEKEQKWGRQHQDANTDGSKAVAKESFNGTGHEEVEIATMAEKEPSPPPPPPLLPPMSQVMPAMKPVLSGKSDENEPKEVTLVEQPCPPASDEAGQKGLGQIVGKGLGKGDGDETANRILALISEIGSSQIIHQSDDEGFHPWFWEHDHGSVMTV